MTSRGLFQPQPFYNFTILASEQQTCASENDAGILLKKKNPLEETIL